MNTTHASAPALAAHTQPRWSDSDAAALSRAAHNVAELIEKPLEVGEYAAACRRDLFRSAYILARATVGAV